MEDNADIEKVEKHLQGLIHATQLREWKSITTNYYGLMYYAFPSRRKVTYKANSNILSREQIQQKTAEIVQKTQELTK